MHAQKDRRTGKLVVAAEIWIARHRERAGRSQDVRPHACTEEVACMARPKNLVRDGVSGSVELGHVVRQSADVRLLCPAMHMAYVAKVGEEHR